MFILQIFEHLFTGDGYHRFDRPARALGKFNDVIFVDCHHQHSRLIELALACDVLVTSHFSDVHLFDLITERRRRGKVTVFETADDYRNPQAWNPIAQLLSDPAVMAEHSRYVECADAVQTSTNALADVWRAHARKIAVFENQLAEFPALAEIRQTPITLGWAGSQGHLADWFEATRYLESWLREHTEVQVAVMSHELARSFLSLPQSRYRFVPTGGMREYLDFLSTLDIGLAPLLPIEWNHTRSDVKFLEYAVSGVVGVYANLTPYASTVKDGETGFLYGSPKEMIAALDHLLEDPTLRTRVRQNAYDYVTRERRLDDHVQERLDFYRSLLPADWVPSAPPLDLLGASTRDHNYLQLSLDPAGQILQSVAQQPARDDTVRAVVDVLSHTPTFASASVLLARMLNDLRRPSEAAPVLREALGKFPFLSTLEAELGRSHAQLKDSVVASEYVLRALEHAPYETRGWHYALGLARNGAIQDISTLVKSLDDFHPLNVHLQLKTVSLLPEEIQASRFGEIIERLCTELSPLQWEASLPIITRQLQQWAMTRLSSPATISLLEKLQRIASHSILIKSLLGLAYRAQGKYDVSLQVLRQAAELQRVVSLGQAEHLETSPLHYLGPIAERIESLE